MGKIKVFISYRRDGADIYPKFLQKSLIDKGFDVFLDTESMRTGTFDTQIYTRIDESSSVLLLLPPNALDRCVNDGDWVRREIEYALRKHKIIIPLMMDGFAGFPDNLPEDITDVRRYNGKRLNPGNWDEVMNWLDEAIRETAEKQIVDVMCPHCGAVSQQDENGRLAVKCSECQEIFILEDGKKTFADQGCVIAQGTLIKYVGKALTLKLPSPDIPDSDEVVIIAEKAFAGNMTLEEIILTEKIIDCSPEEHEPYSDTQRIGVDCIGESAFENCCNLKMVTLPHTMQSIGNGAFAHCEKLKRARLPYHIKDRLLPNRLFDDCVELEYVFLPTTIEIIGMAAFDGCELLKTLAYDETDYGMSLNELLFDIIEEKRQHIVTGLPPHLKTIRFGAFHNCVSLELPSFPEKAKIEYSAFSHTRYHAIQPCFDGYIDTQGLAISDEINLKCIRKATNTDIEIIIVPDGITYIEDFAFFHCEHLTEVHLPESLEVIGKRAFEGCVSLKQINIPNGVKSIGERAFSGTPFAEQYQS